MNTVLILAQQNTPDTMNYMVMGYVIGLLILAVMVVSVWWRYRSLTADETALNTLEAEIKQDQG